MLDIRFSEEPNLRIANIRPEVTVLLPNHVEARPLLVEGNLRIIAHPQLYGQWRTEGQWRAWMNAFVTRHHPTGSWS